MGLHTDSNTWPDTFYVSYNMWKQRLQEVGAALECKDARWTTVVVKKAIEIGGDSV